MTAKPMQAIIDFLEELIAELKERQRETEKKQLPTDSNTLQVHVVDDVGIEDKMASE